MAQFALPFPKLNKSSVAIAGGKGAQLGEMFNAGIPVPPGFVILTASFDLFLERNGLEKKISAILGKVNVHNTSSVDSASKEIRSIISKGAVPDEIRDAMHDEFIKLDAALVAVRSSATAEDAGTASWAGELESYMNISQKNLPETVRKCWSSLFTPRAIFYRIEKKLSAQKVSVAVVVQKMVQSEIAGVIFTVHPVTKDRRQMVIEAAYGLGESVVAGLVSPDNYVVDKGDLSLLDVSVNQQEKMISKQMKGAEVKTVTLPVPPAQRNRQKLDGKRIIELAEICLNIERHYGAPQDIEFAFEKGKFYIVQSRPITTLTK